MSDDPKELGLAILNNLRRELWTQYKAQTRYTQWGFKTPSSLQVDICEPTFVEVFSQIVGQAVITAAILGKRESDDELKSRYEELRSFWIRQKAEALATAKETERAEIIKIIEAWLMPNSYLLPLIRLIKERD